MFSLENAARPDFAPPNSCKISITDGRLCPSRIYGPRIRFPSSAVRWPGGLASRFETPLPKISEGTGPSPPSKARSQNPRSGSSRNSPSAPARAPEPASGASETAEMKCRFLRERSPNRKNPESRSPRRNARNMKFQRKLDRVRLPKKARSQTSRSVSRKRVAPKSPEWSPSSRTRFPEPRNPEARPGEGTAAAREFPLAGSAVCGPGGLAFRFGLFWKPPARRRRALREIPNAARGVSLQ